MANSIAPSGSFHYVGFGIKDHLLGSDKYAKCCVFTRQTDFEDGNEISTENDEGHTGVATLDMGSYRTTAESSPSWTDKLRYNEGFEEVFYQLLGNYTVNPYSKGNATVDGVFKYNYSFPPNSANDLPLSTIYNGFGKNAPTDTQQDGRVWNNAILNEFTMNFSNEDAPTMDLTFISDYNNFNMISPNRTYSAVTNFVKTDQVKIFLGEVGATAEQMLSNPVNCFIESSFTVNNNVESQSCVEEEFGKNSKFLGTRETTGSINMPWVDNTKLLETEYEGADKLAHIVSTEITHKQIWYQLTGTKIVVNDTVTDVPYSTLIKFPNCEITNVETPKSGSDAKDLTLEYKVLENPTSSFMDVELVSNLPNLRIDTTGVNITDLYPPVASGGTNP